MLAEWRQGGATIRWGACRFHLPGRADLPALGGSVKVWIVRAYVLGALTIIAEWGGFVTVHVTAAEAQAWVVNTVTSPHLHLLAVLVLVGLVAHELAHAAVQARLTGRPVHVHFFRFSVFPSMGLVESDRGHVDRVPWYAHVLIALAPVVIAAPPILLHAAGIIGPFSDSMAARLVWWVWIFQALPSMMDLSVVRFALSRRGHLDAVDAAVERHALVEG